MDFIKRNKYKILVASLVTVFLVIIGLGYMKAQAEEDIKSEVERIVSNVTALYTDETLTILADETTIEQINQNTKDIEAARADRFISTSLKNDLEEAELQNDYAKQMLELRDMSYALFDENGVLIADADINAVVEKANEVAKVKPEYVTHLNPYIVEANAQQNAMNQVNSLFTDATRATVRDDVSREELSDVTATVDALKNEVLKKELQTSLDVVDAFLTKQEEEQVTAMVNDLFTDDSRSTVRSGVSREELEDAQYYVDQLSNESLQSELQSSLNDVDNYLDAKEEEERRKAEQQAKELKEPIVLLDVPIISQLPELPTGCEITACTMMYNYAGANVTKLQMADEMPRHGSDPNKGFVGDPYDPGGYTVYPNALMAMTEKYCGSAVNLTGTSVDTLKAYLDAGKPVVVWMEGMYGFNTHAITLTGYSKGGFYFNDPWTGKKNAYMTSDTFKAQWTGRGSYALSY